MSPEGRQFLFFRKPELSEVQRSGINRVLDINTEMQKLDEQSLENYFFNVIGAHPNLSTHFEEIKRAHTEMIDAHRGQKRILSGRAYKTHPEKVALLTIDLLELFDEEVHPDAVIAALKHDMVEDGKEKGITLDTIDNQSGGTVKKIVSALTRHDGQDGQPINHVEAAWKVWREHQNGVAFARIIKLADRIENLRDQPGVARPLEYEEIEYANTNEFARSPYGKWLRTKERTEGNFIDILFRDNHMMRALLHGAIARTTSEINARPKQSILNSAPRAIIE